MSTTYLSAIRVSLPRIPFVAGGAAEGSVRLDIRALREERVGEVRINLKGVFHSSTRRNGPPLTDTIYLAKQSTSVWRRGMPSPSSDILVVPFKFQLPDDLPPSFDFDDGGDRTRITYVVEAVPDRSGSRSTRVEAMLTVVPSDPEGADIKSQLVSGRIGHPIVKTRTEQLCRTHGLVGDATVNLTYPCSTLPMHCSIPYTLHVATVSSPMLQHDSGKIWPSPPAHPREVLAELQQHVHVRIGSQSRTYTSPAQSMWGPTTDVGPFEKEWLPCEDDSTTGRWKQEMTFNSSFAPSSTPSFTFKRLGSSEIRVEYSLHVTIHFGSHHSLTIDEPIVVSSGLHQTENDTAAPAIVISPDPTQCDQGLNSRLDQVELPMSWFRPTPADPSPSNPLRRVITAPETGFPRSRSSDDSGSRLSNRLQEHDIPMEWFTPAGEAGSETPRLTGGRAPAAMSQGHGYTRSLDLLDGSIALLESSIRPGGRRLGAPIPLRPVRSASPPRGGTRRRRNYGAADVPVNMYGVDYGAVVATPRRPARRNRAPAPGFETHRPQEAESGDLPSYHDSVADEPPPYEE